MQLQQWADEFNRGVAFNLNIAWGVPLSHACLLASQRWGSYPFPVPSRGESRMRQALGMKFMQELWRGLDLTHDVPPQPECPLVLREPDHVLQIADILRSCHNHLEGGLQEQVHDLIAKLAHKHDGWSWPFLEHPKHSFP